MLFFTLACVLSCGGLETSSTTRTTSQGSTACNDDDCLYFPPYCWSYVEVAPGMHEWSPNYDRCAKVPCPTLPDLSLAPFAEQVQFLQRDLQFFPSEPCIRGGRCLTQGYTCVQRECAPTCLLDKLQPALVGVLHGIVTAGGEGVANVAVSVVGDSEYGYVLSEWGNFDYVVPYPPPTATGRYFIAVNAGGPVRLRFTKAGYLPAERVVQPVAGQYAPVPVVELVPQSIIPNVIASPVAAWTVASGETVTQGGTRKARLFFPQGTTWTPSTASLDVRLKEYTVGPSGPAKMPAVLPPASAYTYAVEFSATDPSTQSAVNPTFSTPVFAYTENYLGLPVGWVVPSGYYDAQAGAWQQHLAVGAPLNGKIVNIVDYSGGMANVDTDGEGGADNIGLSSGERALLYQEFQPNQNVQLWRVPITHFSPNDFNFQYNVNANATAPKVSVEPASGGVDCPSQRAGSIVECEPQVLGEELPIAGTPYRLVYRSSRMPGYRPAWTLQVRTDSATAAANGAQKVLVKGEFAGKPFAAQQAVPTTGSNLTFTLESDGKDAFGRTVTSPQPATVEVGYTYQGSYMGTKRCVGAAGCAAHQSQSACVAASCTWEEPIFGAPPGATYVTGNNTTQQVTLWSVWKGTLGAQDARTVGLGGWTLDAHHSYSRPTETILYGWGGQRRAKAIGDVLTTVAGVIPGTGTYAGGPFVGSQQGGGITFGPKGELYITERNTASVKKLEGGVFSTIITTGLTNPVDVAATSDGKLYIADEGKDCILRWDGSGTPAVVAGIPNVEGNGGDGTATTIALRNPNAIEIGPDGALYIADSNNNKIRRLDANGYLTRVAGNAAGDLAVSGGEGDGGLATADGARLYTPKGLAFGPDGSLYISQWAGATNGTKARIRRVAPNGTISTYAGGGSGPASQEDGVAATAAAFDSPRGLAFGSDGSLFVADSGSHRIRRVAPAAKDGTLGTYVSSVAGTKGQTGCSSADGTSATAALIDFGASVAVDGQGQVNYVDLSCPNVRKIRPPALGSVAVGELTVPSEDGRELYVFNDLGRHVRTLDGLVQSAGSPAVRFEFVYQDYWLANGLIDTRLTQIKDRRGATNGTGKVTQITRLSDGTPQAIVSPTGSTSGLQLDSGYLWYLVPPDYVAHFYYYDSGGLLTTMFDGRWNWFTFEYSTSSPAGLLLKDRDSTTQAPDPAFLSLDKSLTADGWSRVEATSARGVVTKYDTRAAPDGSVERRVIRPDGTTVNSKVTTGGTATVVLADGTERNVEPIKDVRFGMAAATSEVTTELPGAANKKLITRTARTITTSPGQNGITEFSKLTETRTTKKDAADAGLAHKTEWDRGGSPHVIRTISPTGRKVKRELDSHGRVAKLYYDATTSEVAPVDLAYDTLGRLTSVSQSPAGLAGRRTKLAWNPSTGYLEYIRRGTVSPDADLFTTKLVTDERGRVREVFGNEFPSSNQTKLSYDGNDNLVAVEIPNGSGGWRYHAFDYDFVSLLYGYNPPDVAGYDYVYLNARDADRRWFVTQEADGGGSLGLYDDPPYGGSGKLSLVYDLTTWGVARSYGYDPASGKLASISANNGATNTSYSYSGSGLQAGWEGLLFRTSTSWSGMAREAQYTYDDYLRRKTETVTGGQTLTYGYDADSLVTSVQLGALATYTLQRSGQSGRLEKAYTGTLSTGVVTSLVYDAGLARYGDLTGLTTTCPGTSGSVAYGLTLAYDSLGRVDPKTENIQGSTTTIDYDYDSAGRLWKETPTGFSAVTYGYDASGNKNGNRTSATYPPSYPSSGAPFANQSRTYDAQDRISSAGYSFDADGQLVSATVSGVTYTYVWDDFGKLIQVTSTAGLDVRYTYDGLGRRVSRSKLNAPTEERRYLYDEGSRLLAVYDGSGTLLQQFVYATGRHVPDLMIQSNTTVFHLLTDQVGSVRRVVSTAGSPAQQTDYDAWGRIKSDSVPGFQPFGFAGGLYDKDTGLVQMGARWYDPVVGRFVKKDPILFGGGQVNLYAYVGNDPVNRKDPSGLQEQLPAGTFDWLYKLFDVKDEATRAANLMYPLEMHNGRGDAFKHCLASCEAAQGSSAWISALIGWSNEKYGNWYGQPIEEEQMDYHNNACGRSYSDRIDQSRMSAAGASNNCWNACWAGVRNQDLVYDVESPGYSGKNPYL